MRSPEFSDNGFSRKEFLLNFQRRINMKRSGFKRVLVTVLVYSMVLIVSCSTWTVKIDRENINKIKKVALVMYTVPPEIKYRDDPKKKAPRSLKDVAIAVAQQASYGDGIKAATTSYKSFVDELNNQGLPFRILSYNEVVGNKAFAALYKPPKADVKKSVMGSAMGMLGIGSGPKKGSAPEGINQYGLSEDAWGMNTALLGSDDEKKYLEDAIKALGVDGILVIQDTGFSFTCKGCAGPIGGPMSGVASSGSSFIATLFDRKLNPVINLKEYFLTTPANAPMVANIIVPTLHEKMFKEHGKKMAIVYADKVKKELNKKK